MTRVFSKFPEMLPRRDLLILAAAAVLAAAIYLLASAITSRIGFPLDDSWIHLTYARNLAERGEWAYRPGLQSAGSTAPLWSALLAIGFLLNLGPYLWTYLIGVLCLWTLAVVAERIVRRLLPVYQPGLPLVGLFFIFEWHMLWAGMSGMETLLHALIVTTVLSALMTGSHRYLTLGLLTGLSVWVRPDGLTLLAPIALTILLNENNWPSRLKALLRFGIGFGSLFFFYLLFNLVIGGTPMPNTFYAKQAEYASWQARPLAGRVGELLLQLMVGPGLFILPGAIMWAVSSIRRRAWGTLAGMLWFLGYLALYISRLPVYQHGRYIMPAMPVFFLWGLLALVEFSHARRVGRYTWLWKAFWQFCVAFMTTGFVILGARSYAKDVALIETEMVTSAQWAAQNIPPGALIAAHDIGALGYFDDHALIDLAGLISPEVIPFIRNESRLAAYLDERGADYLIAFPDFYTELLLQKEVIFVTNGQIAPTLGGVNMTIFRWKAP